MMGQIDESRCTVMANLRRVIEFAKANGFPRAEMAMWHDDDPEPIEPETLTDSCYQGEVLRVRLGVYLHGELFVSNTYDEAKEESLIVAHDTLDAAESAVAPLFTSET